MLCPSLSLYRFFNSLLLTIGTPRRSQGRLGYNVKGPRRTMGWGSNRYWRGSFKGTHRDLKDRRLYLSLHSDLWDVRMADFLFDYRRVRSLGVLRNNKLLARLSNFPLLSLIASIPSALPSTSNFLTTSYLTFFSLHLPTGVVAPIASTTPL